MGVENYEVLIKKENEIQYLSFLCLVYDRLYDLYDGEVSNMAHKDLKADDIAFKELGSLQENPHRPVGTERPRNFGGRRGTLAEGIY